MGIFRRQLDSLKHSSGILATGLWANLKSAVTLVKDGLIIGSKKLASGLWTGTKMAAGSSKEFYTDYQASHPAAKAYARKAAKERFEEAAEIGAVGAIVVAAIMNPEIGIPAAMMAAATQLNKDENMDVVKRAALFPAKCLHDKRTYEFLAGVPSEGPGLKNETIIESDLEFVKLSHRI